MIGSLFLIGAASIVNAADPCSAICDAIPGVCGLEGSRCIDKVCTNVFWAPNSTLCSSSTRNCPNEHPLTCVLADQVLTQEGHFGITAFDPDALDPCVELCKVVPGACDGVESVCLYTAACSNLFWYSTGSLLCNSSQCNVAGMMHVSCDSARSIVVSENKEGIRVSKGARYHEPSVVHDFWFAPGPDALGRRGFTCRDGAASSLASVLQVLLHSEAIRIAIMNEIDFGWSLERIQNPMFSSLVSLLNQMFGVMQEGPVDLTEFRSSMKEVSLDPIQLLRYILEPIVRVSRDVEKAVRMVTVAEESCLECFTMDEETIINEVVQVVSFPLSTPTRDRWTIKELLEPQLSDVVSVVDGGCPLCRRADGLKRRLLTWFPDLLIVGIDRRPGSSTGRVNSYLETPMEMDFGGIVEDGNEHRYRLVGIVREINGKYVADYFDSDKGEWMHANDKHLHVIQGQPRNGGSDAVVVLYQSI